MVQNKHAKNDTVFALTLSKSSVYVGLLQLGIPCKEHVRTLPLPRLNRML